MPVLNVDTLNADLFLPFDGVLTTSLSIGAKSVGVRICTANIGRYSVSRTSRTDISVRFPLFSGLCPAGVAFVKSIYAAGGIDQLLLAGKERVALGTDFDVQLLAQR